MLMRWLLISAMGCFWACASYADEPPQSTTAPSFALRTEDRANVKNATAFALPAKSPHFFALPSHHFSAVAHAKPIVQTEQMEDAPMIAAATPRLVSHVLTGSEQLTTEQAQQIISLFSPDR